MRGFGQGIVKLAGIADLGQKDPVAGIVEDPESRGQSYDLGVSVSTFAGSDFDSNNVNLKN